MNPEWEPERTILLAKKGHFLKMGSFPQCFREQIVDVYNFSEQKENNSLFQSVDPYKRFYTKSHPYPLFTITFELSAFIGISEEQKANERNEVRGGVMRAV